MNKKNLSNLMLLSNFVCTLFYAASYPYIYAETLKVVSRPYIAVEQILGCLGTIVFSQLWNKFGEKLFKKYKVVLVTEIVADIGLFSMYFITHNLKWYFLLNVIIYATITKNLASGGVKMRAKVNPDEQSRNRYDNNDNCVNSAATLIGAGISLITHIPLNALFIFALIGNIIDNFFYLFIYNKLTNKDKLGGNYND